MFLQHHMGSVLALVIGLGAVAVHSAEPVPAVRTDALVSSWVQEALERRPEVTQAAANVAGDQERISQAAALPDPSLTLGIQNDSFSQYSIGKMETSWYTVMATQNFPFPGKRSRRADVARVQPQIAAAFLQRTRISIEAEVRRAYVELLLVRDQLQLLERQNELWKKSEGLAKARYAVGEAPQSDLLRAQLELTRLRQQRQSLSGAESMRLEALNRARGHALDETVITTSSLEQLGAPPLFSLEAAQADAANRSPELSAASFGVAQMSRRLDLARAEQLPDFSVSAGVMPRGALVPMWQLNVGITLPVYSSSKQNRAVAEAEDRERAARQEHQALLELLRLRVAQRHALLEALTRENTLYRETLLVQSEATATSTLDQYQVGKVPFASVLEALGGYLVDEGGYLASMAEAQRLSIAELELSLDAPSGPSIPFTRGPSMSPGAKGGPSSPAPPASAAEPAAPMGGM